MLKRLLAGAAVCLLLAGAAHAQVQAPGWFDSLTGFYAFPREGTESDIALGVGRVAPGRALGGILHGGYRFGAIDVAVGLQGAVLENNVQGDPLVVASNKANTFAVDLEAGYNIAAAAGVGMRPSLGIRFARWHHEHGFPSLAGGFIAGGATGSATVNTWGIGPRLGFDGSVRLSDSFSLFLGGGGSILFGRLKESGSFPVPFPPPNRSNGRTMVNADLKAGIAFEPIDAFSIALGYRFDYWDGATVGTWSTAFGGPGGGRGHRLIHGPFVRLAYNWGPPPLDSRSEPAPVPHDLVFIVFFDFDHAALTSQALTTIRQAAAVAKTRRVTRVTLVGHADRSGTDAYNMALSLRRANAVKDQLVREGIAASEIVVIGRGESQPLVPTADGVREPQNRRVEIDGLSYR